MNHLGFSWETVRTVRRGYNKRDVSRNRAVPWSLLSLRAIYCVRGVAENLEAMVMISSCKRFLLYCILVHVFSVRSIRFHLVAGLPIHPAVALWADSTRHESSGASRIRIIIHTIQSSNVSARPRRELRESQRQSIHCCTLKPTDQADLAVVYKGVSARFRRVGESYLAAYGAMAL
jgi:hypothetical protein